jgi:hypothetical protein
MHLCTTLHTVRTAFHPRKRFSTNASFAQTAAFLEQILPSNARQTYRRYKSVSPDKLSSSSQNAPSRLATQRVSALQRAGKTSRREGHRRRLALRPLVSLSAGSPVTGSDSRRSALSTTANLFGAFHRSVTPHLALSSIRRGKRTFLKIAPLPRRQGRRTAFRALASSLTEAGSVSRSFSDRLHPLLLGLARASTTAANPSAKGPTNTSGASSTPLRDRRNALHQEAYSLLPRGWLASRLFCRTALRANLLLKFFATFPM